MADPRLNRIEGTLTSLLESIVPALNPDQDDTDTEFRIDRAIQNAKDLVYNAVNGLPSDTNQAQDLIKRKLLRENQSPEKAARFSNLYSRLLAIPVLNQKWAILYLLYKLSDNFLPDVRSRDPLVDSDQLANIPWHQTLSPKKPIVADDPDGFEEESASPKVAPPKRS